MKRHGSAVNPLTVNLPSKHGVGRSETENFNCVKESYLAFFNCRYPQRPGHYILDITRRTNTDSTERFQPQTYSVSTHGIKSGS
jgi:hypothetical protein